MRTIKMTTGAKVPLVSEGSFLPSLRDRLEGQANFINPGLFLFNVGTDVELTPKWRVSANINWMLFHKTDTLELILNQNRINRSIGTDLSVGVKHRPFLNENLIIFFGASALTSETLASSLVGSLARRSPEDLAILNKYWHGVIEPRSKDQGGEWNGFLEGGRRTIATLS